MPDFFSQAVYCNLLMPVRIVYLVLLAMGFTFACKNENRIITSAIPVTYYIDQEDGNDEHLGNSKTFPWRSLSKLTHTKLFPGDTVRFKRGTQFIEPLLIKDSGNPQHPIVLTDYGDYQLPAPSFTNPVFELQLENYGNCVRLQGDYIIVENLYFHDTPAEIDDPSISFPKMWELGAVYVDKMAEHCIVRNNEFQNCGVAVKSYGKNTLIESNYIHDCNRILKKWTWGPIGIWLGADHQEVRYNQIVNYSAVDPRISWGPNSYGGGADGGAIEIDDARNAKSDIHIHHNYSRDCQGFLEVTWTDVLQNPEYIKFNIHHNISDDYQQFVAIWRGADFRIENNTIIRRKVNANDWGVFNITQNNGKNLIRNNIIVVEKDIPIYNLGRKGMATPNNIIESNLYFAASGDMNMGLEGPGEGAVFSDPMFTNYSAGTEPEDFKLTNASPAIDRGLVLGYSHDFNLVNIPQGNVPDIGAFEYVEN